jgi:hypothetical protein
VAYTPSQTQRGGGQRKSGRRIPAYLGHIDEIKTVRKAVGDDFTLLFDPVQGYNYFEALKVGRVLDDQGYVSFEDPIPTTEIEGLIELRKNLDAEGYVPAPTAPGMGYPLDRAGLEKVTTRIDR